MSEELRNYLHAHPPRCISGLVLQRGGREDGNPLTVVSLRLSSNRHESVARIRGHSLKRLNDAYQGQPRFVSPISLQWHPSGVIDLIFDSQVDGYRAGMGGSEKRRGAGEPDHWVCPKCGSELFVVEVKFDYASTDEIWEFEPECLIENYFVGIRIFGECVGCSEVSQAVRMGV